MFCYLLKYSTKHGLWWMWDGWRCLQEEAKERGVRRLTQKEKCIYPLKRDLKVGCGHLVYSSIGNRPPDAKSRFIGEDPDVGIDWRQEEKGITEDEIVGWHHWLNGHEFEQAPGDGEGQGSLACAVHGVATEQQRELFFIWWNSQCKLFEAERGRCAWSWVTEEQDFRNIGGDGVGRGSETL